MLPSCSSVNIFVLLVTSTICFERRSLLRILDGWIHRILENCEFLEATTIVLSPKKLLLRILELINSMLILLKKRLIVIGLLF